MKRIKLAWALGLVAGIFSGNAVAADRLILAPRQQIEASCQKIRALGVSCYFVDAAGMTGPSGGALRWVPVGTSDLYPEMPLPADSLSLLERMSKKQFHGQLILFMQHDAAQQPYYMGHMAVLTERPTNTADPVLDPSKEEAAWSVIADSLSFDLPDSDASRKYLGDLDAAAAAQADAARKEADAASDRRTFENSPEYKRRQLQSAAEQCRKTIRYAQKLIDRDKRIAAVSGVVNMSVREQAASMIVDCEDVISQANKAQ